MSTETDTSVGPYRLEGLIGRGGMGEVHRAFDTRRQRAVALKLLPTALSQDPTYRERFRRESLTAAGLASPHVVPIHDFGEVAGRLFIDMRLIEGRDLADQLRGGAFSPARALGVLAQLTDALGDAHDHGIVHRDVKPSNVLLTGADFAYLLDFGIAHSSGDASLTETGTTVGTFGYMAPERLDGATSDARADVYSLACVLCEMLTGHRPFAQHTSTPSLIRAHLHDPPPRPSQLNPAVEAGFDEVIARGMAKDPQHRYPTVAELLAAARNVSTPRRAPTRPNTMTAVGGFTSFAADPPDDTCAAASAPRAGAAPSQVGAPKPRRGARLAVLGLAAVLLLGAGAGAATLLGASSPTASPAQDAPPIEASSAGSVPALGSGTGASPAASTAPSGGYRMRISGTAKTASINFTVDGSAGSATATAVPWSKDVPLGDTTSHFAMLSAFSSSGDPGTVICTITDLTGRVVSTHTAASQGGQFGSASVNCSGK